MTFTNIYFLISESTSKENKVNIKKETASIGKKNDQPKDSVSTKSESILLKYLNAKKVTTSMIVETSYSQTPDRKNESKGNKKSLKEKKNYFYDYIYNEKSGKYTCKSCKRTYKNRSTFITHKKINCGAEPKHKCVYCEFRGRSLTSVRCHIGHKHGKWPKLNSDGVWIY